MNKELEEAIKRLKNIVDKCKIETKEIGYECDLYDGDEPIPYKAIETVLNYIDNSISKEVIEEKIEEVRKMKFKDKRLNGATVDFAVYKFEELLERR